MEHEHNNFSFFCFDQSSNRQRKPTKDRQKKNTIQAFNVLKGYRETLNVISCLDLIINCWPTENQRLEFLYLKFGLIHLKLWILYKFCWYSRPLKNEQLQQLKKASLVKFRNDALLLVCLNGLYFVSTF